MNTRVTSLFALAVLSLTPLAHAQGQPPPWIPGLAVPVSLPTGFAWGAVTPVSPGTPGQPPPMPVPPTTAAAPPLPPGSIDGGGFLTQAFEQTEAADLLQTLVATLPPAKRQRVAGIPLLIDAQSGEVNAFAGCENGKSYMAFTVPLLRIVGHIAEAKAADELTGGQHVDAYTKLAADATTHGAPPPDPPPGFYGAEAMDPRKLSRQRVVFDEMAGFILGHELGHHYLGHTGCANGDVSGGLDPRELGRIASHILPGFNQPNEAAADIAGTQNLLDVGAARAGGLTEMGAVLTLQFFGTMQQLTPTSVALAILRTHPAPQLRIPLVQSTAQAWRASRASGGTPPLFPFPFPFPFPLSSGPSGAVGVPLRRLDRAGGAPVGLSRRAALVGRRAPLSDADRGALGAGEHRPGRPAVLRQRGQQRVGKQDRRHAVRIGVRAARVRLGPLEIVRAVVGSLAAHRRVLLVLRRSREDGVLHRELGAAEEAKRHRSANETAGNS